MSDEKDTRHVPFAFRVRWFGAVENRPSCPPRNLGEEKSNRIRSFYTRLKLVNDATYNRVIRAERKVKKHTSRELSSSSRKVSLVSGSHHNNAFLLRQSSALLVDSFASLYHYADSCNVFVPCTRVVLVVCLRLQWIRPCSDARFGTATKPRHDDCSSRLVSQFLDDNQNQKGCTRH